MSTHIIIEIAFEGLVHTVYYTDKNIFEDSY